MVSLYVCPCNSEISQNFGYIYIYYAYIYILSIYIIHIYIYIIFSSRSIPSTVDPALLPRTDPCIAGDLDCVKSIGLSGTGQGGKSF